MILIVDGMREEFFRFNKPWEGMRIIMVFCKEDSLIRIILSVRKVHKKDNTEENKGSSYFLHSIISTSFVVSSNKLTTYQSNRNNA